MVMSSEGRANADGLGRCARSGIAGCGASSGSESLPETSDLVPCCFGALDVFVFPFGADGTEASEAARSNLSSWYLRRVSSGRMPFSIYIRSSTNFFVTASSRDGSSAESGEDWLRILRIIRKTRLCR